MNMKPSLFAGVAVGLLVAMGAGVAAHAEPAARSRHQRTRVVADPTLVAKVDALSAEVAALERRLDAEEAARGRLESRARSAQADAARARADAQAAQARLVEQIQTLPGEVDAAVAAKAPRTPAVSVTLGGFSAFETIYRSRNDVADIGSNYSKIPYLDQATAHEDETRFSARQSRLSLLVQGDIDPTTHAAFYGEFDFLGAGQTANSNESNSYQPRIRQVYGTVDWDDLGLHVLAGQTWSLATMNGHGITPRAEDIPPTIEAQYVPGFVWARQPQLRVAWDYHRQLWVAVSAENPQTTFAGAETGAALLAPGVSANVANAGVSLLNNQVAYSDNRYPDVIGKVAFEPMLWGGQPLHLEVFGIWRDYYDRVAYAVGNSLGAPAGAADRQASGGGVGGGFTFTVVPHRIDVQGSFLTGKGVGRYGSGQLPDAVEAADGAPVPIGETMFLVGGTLHATPALDLYAYYGQERESRAALEKLGPALFGYGNPNAVLGSGCFAEGASCSPDTQQIDQITAGLWQRVYSGRFGFVRVGVQYSHTSLTAFSGFATASLAARVTPATSDDMVFTSFRYFPNF
ncbi:MAG TPA: hypothetical protein VMU93_12815 [Caulobacteraceae bacterium]|nr:hypothetical protein [Caulobacteraceae bacterium]